MNQWGFAIISAFLVLGGCANKSVVIVQSKPSGSAGIDWGSSSLTARPNAGQTEPCQQLSAPQVANQPNYRQLIVSVESQDMAPIRLSKNDLKIRDGDQEIAVQFFQQKEASVGILVDGSGSMEPKMIQAKATLTDLIDGLNRNDEAFLIVFSSRPFLLQNFTRNRELLKQDLTLIHPFGQTAMRDAIVQGLLLIRHGCYPNKALFVMTDGMDNTSSVSSADMISAMKQSKVPIFAIGIGNKEAHPLFMGAFMVGGDEDWVDAPTLQNLASSSGGKAYILPVLGNAKAKKAALSIADEIDNHYAIGFAAPANGKIQIELLNHPEARLRIDSAPPDLTVVNLSHS